MASRDFRIDRSSRRRRWTALRQAVIAEGLETSNEAGISSPAAALPPAAGAESIPAEIDRATESLPSEAQLPGTVGSRWQQILERPAVLVWLVLGDSLMPAPDPHRNWRSFDERLLDLIRQRTERQNDVLVRNLQFARPLAESVASNSELIARLRPDVVLVSIGPQETTAGRSGLDAFERHLLNLITAISQMGGLAVVCTAPCVPTADPDQQVVQMIYAGAVRAIAAEYDLPCVDHFVAWETASRSDAALRSPGDEVHRRLAETIALDLGLAGRRSVPMEG